MTSDWQVEDFGLTKTGPQFEWLNQRLTLHGYPFNKYMSTLKERVRALQLALGYTGTGADGLMGPKTLAFLKTSPGVPIPTPPVGISTKNWKETLPIGEPGHPDEVYPINGFQVDPWFVQRNGHLIFRCNAGGVKTATSVHPRSELREMNGDAKAKWDTNNGKDHILKGRLAINALTPKIPIAVVAQCHDLIDDVFMLAAVGQMEDPKRCDIQIWRSKGKDQGNEKIPVLRDLRLLDFFDYNMVFTESGFFLAVNDKPVYEYGGAWEDCYWKAGCYPQTNVAKGEKASAFSEVDYERLLASHI
jgi:poly(beta-D-mannuronate) lyase